MIDRLTAENAELRACAETNAKDAADARKWREQTEGVGDVELTEKEAADMREFDGW